MPLRRFISLHRPAAAAGGAVLLAALTVSGSAAGKAAAPAFQPVSAPPVAAAPGVPATGRYIEAGAVFQLDVGYTCPSKWTGQVSMDVHQNLRNGFVANGFGFAPNTLTCNGKRHTVRITVVPNGEHGFTRGPAYAITQLFSCPPKSKACEPTPLERIITVR